MASSTPLTPDSSALDPTEWASWLEKSAKPTNGQIGYSEDGRVFYSPHSEMAHPLSISAITEISQAIWKRASCEERGKIFRSQDGLFKKLSVDQAASKAILDFHALTANFIDSPSRTGYEEPERFVGRVELSEGVNFEGIALKTDDEEDPFIPYEGKIWKDGQVVQEGIFKECQLSSGKVYWNDFVFEGNFINDELVGAGKIWREGQIIREGIFEQGQLKSGKMTDIIGNAFEGSFDSRGRLHGLVSVELVDGKKIEVVFTHGRPSSPFESYSEAFADKAYRLLLNLPQSSHAAYFESSLFLSDPLLQPAVVARLKGSLTPETAKLYALYPTGIHYASQALTRDRQAKLFLSKMDSGHMPGVNTSAEQAGLLRICQHRHNYGQYAMNMALGKEKEALEDVIENIALLDDPSSSKVIALPDGSTFFSIPGGWSDHAITYGFQKKGDDYFFEIYNRGDRGGDTVLHGEAVFIHEGKAYAKAMVTIQTTKAVIQNPEFIKDLIIAVKEPTGKRIYARIREHFSGKGVSVCSKEEVMLEQLYKYLQANPTLKPATKSYLHALAVRLMDLDPHFHSLQSYGSCAESNPTLPEKFMSPPSTRTALKLCTTAGYVDSISRRILSSHAPTLGQATLVIDQLKLEGNKLVRKLGALPSKIGEIDPLPEDLDGEVRTIASQMKATLEAERKEAESLS